MDISIIGDAFVDVLCFLEDKQQDEGSSSDANQIVLPLGSDTLLKSPVTSIAGGSGLNTATHLGAVIRDFGATDKDNEFYAKLELQTVLNEHDEHGKLLLRHASRHNLPLWNCCKKNQADSGVGAPTGHCIVIISKGDRTFLTHRGCVEEFGVESINLERLTEGNDHQHIHIAGYYNMPHFWNGKLKQKLDQLRQARSLKNCTTTISLVPQYDSTEKWDGQLLELLPCIDFFIMSDCEASNIFPSQFTEREHDMALYLQSISPNIYAIITKGKKGVVALHNGHILHTRDGNIVENVTDTTGAGDAFAAGFIHGVLIHLFQKKCGTSLSNEIQEVNAMNEAVKNGLKWGCATGAGCVTKAGASVPSTREEIIAFLG